jgi:branched-chain amino acid transport system ATP-binding protein
MGNEFHDVASVGARELRCSNVSARYGSHIVCHGISVAASPGEIVALLGPNGAGKSTFVGAISGTVASAGQVTLGQTRLEGKAPHTRARMGLATIPDSRGLFGSLTVAENIRLGARLAPRAERGLAVDEAVSLFPILRMRWSSPAGAMSGGEQQMLAIAKCLVGRPGALVLDEPTQGLAPVIVDEVGQLLVRLKEKLPILLIEQNLGMVEKIADRFSVMASGRIVLDGTRDALRDRGRILRAFIDHRV